MVTGSTEEMRNLAKALLDYGNAAQYHFQYGNYTEIDPTISPEVQAVKAEDINGGKGIERTGELPAGVVKTGASVNFQSDHSLRISYTTDGKKTLAASDVTVDPKNSEAFDDKGNGLYYVRELGIPGAKLAEEYTFTLGGHKTVISGVRYAAQMAKTGSETMKTLCKALWLYYKACDANFNK
jgi:hypothetical protein